MSKEIRTEQEFRELLKTGRKMLVLFYSAWCPYCQRFLPVYEAHCKGETGAYCRIAVDANYLDEAYGVEVVPSVLCFENGEVRRRLDGEPGKGLNETQLIDFMKSCDVR